MEKKYVLYPVSKVLQCLTLEKRGIIPRCSRMIVNLMKRGISIALFAVVLMASPVFAAKGIALITATQQGSNVNGQATLNEIPTGLEVEVKVANVPPGKHGFHIHEKGSCSDEGKAAGGHYNPDGVAHGLVMKDGFEHAHAGDFGNIEVGPDGTGTLKLVIPGLTLAGEKYNVEGKAVILHEKVDDFGQPTGNAGARIGCGVIMLQDETDSRADGITEQDVVDDITRADQADEAVKQHVSMEQ